MTEEIAKPKTHSVEFLEKYWNDCAINYEKWTTGASFCSGQTMISLMDMSSRNDILEIACGGGSIACEVVARKRPDANFTCMDLGTKFMNITYTKLKMLEDSMSDGKFQETFNKIQSRNFWANATEIKWEEFRDKKLLENLHVTLLRDNAETLPEVYNISNQYDCIFSNMAIHLFTDTEKILKSIFTMLKEKGMFCFTVRGSTGDINQMSMVPDLLAKAGLQLKQGTRSLWHMSDIKKTTKMLEETGFKNVRYFDSFTPVCNDLTADGITEFKKNQRYQYPNIWGPENAEVYNDVMDNHLEKAYIKLVEEEKKTLGYVTCYFYCYK